jgi:hypothetical protein
MADAIEVLNGRGSEEENTFSLKISKELNLRGMGSSDAHEVVDIGSGATFFQRRISNLQELIAELKAGRFRVANPPT